MADVLITIKIMPLGPDEALNTIADSASQLISSFGGRVNNTRLVDIAFGLRAIEIMFIMPEAKGSTESLEEQIKKLPGVSSVDVIDVRRAIG